MKAEREPVTPFYKEPMVLLVAGIPLLAVIWGFVMLNLALGSKDSLVSDSYYKDGVSFTENVEVDAKATALNIQAELTFNSSDAVLQLSGDFSGEAEPASLQLKLIHPTLQEQDLECVSATHRPRPVRRGKRTGVAAAPPYLAAKPGTRLARTHHRFYPGE